MSQGKKLSLIESLVNTFIGMVITFAISPFLYWLCDVAISLPQMGALTLLFTIISIIRNYIIRRIFENIEKWKKKINLT